MHRHQMCSLYNATIRAMTGPGWAPHGVKMTWGGEHNVGVRHMGGMMVPAVACPIAQSTGNRMTAAQSRQAAPDRTGGVECSEFMLCVSRLLFQSNSQLCPTDLLCRMLTDSYRVCR